MFGHNRLYQEEAEEEEEGTAPVMEGTPCMVSDEKTTPTVLNTWCASGYEKVVHGLHVHVYTSLRFCSQ